MEFTKSCTDFFFLCVEDLNGSHGWKGMSSFIQKRQIIEANMTRKQKLRYAKKRKEDDGCHALTSLSLRGCYNIKSKGLQALAYCSGNTLQKLNLKGLPGINAWTFDALAVSLVHLCYLDVSGQLNKTSSLAFHTAKELAKHDGSAKEKLLARGDFYGHPLARMSSDGGGRSRSGASGTTGSSGTTTTVGKIKNNTNTNATATAPHHCGGLSNLKTTCLGKNKHCLHIAIHSTIYLDLCTLLVHTDTLFLFLETIVMTDSTNIPGSILTHVFQNQTSGRLINVHLRGCKNVDNQVLFSLGTQCKGLRVLLVGACELISDNGIIALCTGQWPPAPSLSKETQKYVPKTTLMLAHEEKKRKKQKQKQTETQGCTQLLRIGLCGLWKVTDIGIQALATHCTQLHTLDVRENTQLTNRSIDSIQQHLFSLESLSLCCLASFDQDRLSRCARALPLVHNVPHVRGPHVVVKYLNKSWLHIQRRRALHKRSIIVLQKGIKKYFASKRSLHFKIARAELIVLKRARMATRLQARLVRGIQGRIYARERRKELIAIRKARRKSAAIRIQCCIRRWLAFVYVGKIRKGNNSTFIFNTTHIQ